MAIDTTDPTDPTHPSFRAGYREGFHDGFRDGVKDGLRDGLRETESRQADKDKDKAKDKKEDDKDGEKKEDKPEDKKDGDKDGKDGKKPLYKRPLVVAIGLLVLLAAIIAAIVFWRHSRHHEKTDDAFVDGRASTVAAQAAGRVLKLYVTDNQFVHAGDVLLDIDSRDNEARSDEARAQLANVQGQAETSNAQVEVRRAAALQAAASTRQAQAELTRAEQDLDRFRHVDAQAVSRQQVDQAEASERTARANVDAARSAEKSAQAQIGAALAQVRAANGQLEAARANVASSDLQLSYNKVVAPVDGRITRRTIEVGNVISVGQPLLSVVSDSLWVTANYKETQLTEMKPGQQVSITIDAFPDVVFHGHVDSIQRGTGAYFSMLPAENATGNYVKVVQRVPVKILFDSDIRNYPIGPGMSVQPDVDLP